MRWCAVAVRSPAGERNRVAAWLVGRTGRAVEEREDGILVGVAPDEREAGRVIGELQSAFGGQVAGSMYALPEADWTERWKAGLRPRRIGRLTVTPSWLGAVPALDTIVLDPEMAFGSGEHGSTRTALVLLDRYVRPGDRVLDLGSGSGILSIAAAKLGASRATGVDLDPDVEPIARANAQRNEVDAVARFVTGDAAILTPLLAPVDLVLSNILRAENQALLPVVRAALAPGGRVIFAGMEAAERDAFLAALAAARFEVLDDAVDPPWWGVVAQLV